jgi:hypothetical protein
MGATFGRQGPSLATAHGSPRGWGWCPVFTTREKERSRAHQCGAVPREGTQPRGSLGLEPIANPSRVTDRRASALSHLVCFGEDGGATPVARTTVVQEPAVDLDALAGKVECREGFADGHARTTSSADQFHYGPPSVARRGEETRKRQQFCPVRIWSSLQQWDEAMLPRYRAQRNARTSRRRRGARHALTAAG